MSRRFYLPGDWQQSPLWLTDNEAHHLLHVLRAKPGEVIELFDGRGHCCRAEILETQKKKVLLQRIETRPDSGAGEGVESVKAVEADKEIGTRELVIATAIPKGDRFRWLVEKLTELGVSKLQPLITQRSVVTPRESKLDKQEQYVIEACKQSGRNTLLQIESPLELTSFLKQTTAGESAEAGCLVVGTPRRTVQAKSALQQRLEATSGSITAVIGPEGGFSPEEEQQLQESGAVELCCGPHILRTETAGLACATLLLHLRDKHIYCS